MVRRMSGSQSNRFRKVFITGVSGREQSFRSWPYLAVALAGQCRSSAIVPPLTALDPKTSEASASAALSRSRRCSGAILTDVYGR